MKDFQPPPRFVNLTQVLKHCSELDRRSNGTKTVFTTGERIAINQERGSIYTQISYESGEIDITETRNYQVSENIENKIKFTLNKINNQ